MGARDHNDTTLRSHKYLTGSERGDVISTLNNTAGVLGLIVHQLRGVADPAITHDLELAARRLTRLAGDLHPDDRSRVPDESGDPRTVVEDALSNFHDRSLNDLRQALEVAHRALGKLQDRLPLDESGERVVAIVL